MALTAWEREVLKKSRRKKMVRVVKITSILLVITAIGMGWAVVSRWQNNSAKGDQVTTTEAKDKSAKQDTAVTTNVLLELNEDEIEVEQGQSIDYKKYIEKAQIDDQDMTDKVIYTEISTSDPGKKSIIYSLKPTTGTAVTRLLTVTITEKNEESEASAEQEETPARKDEQTSTAVQSPPVQQAEQPSVQVPSSNPVQTMPQPVPVQPSTPAAQPYTKNFMFSDGYNMGNVEAACQGEGVSSGMSWACEPIRDGGGIILGMKLMTY